MSFATLLAPLAAWVQTTGLARTIAESLLLTGALSAIHLVGFTLLMGAAIVSNLRLLGVLFPDQPVPDVIGSVDRGLGIGLAISVATGLLLFSARATTAIENSTFQLKMALLVAAALFHFTVHRGVAARSDARQAVLRTTGAAGLMLWFSVALAGCAFILLE